jgi:hypothetical protein
MTDLFNIFQNVRALGFADDLKLFMSVKNTDDCQLFQSDLDRLSEWCRANKFNLNVANCKSISFCRKTHPIDYAYSIEGTYLEKVNEFKDIGVIMDNKMTFLPYIESVIA